MKVVILGAGQVGGTIARYLAQEGNDVVIVDQDPNLIRILTDELDVVGIVGFASHPNILEQAGLNDADMLIAVTHSDEVNMIACLMAQTLFGVPTKIARVRDKSYSNSKWSSVFSSELLGIDAVISPEIEVAEAIHRRLEVPGAFDAIPFADNLVTLIGVRCTENCPILNTPLKHLTTLFPDLHVTVIGIVRNDIKIIPEDMDSILPGDQVYFIAETKHLKRALSAFGHEEKEARRLIIVGGGHIGSYLAQLIAKHDKGSDVKIIELDRKHAESIAQALPEFAVIRGDALDEAILSEANVSGAETIIAVTNNDEVNILSSLLAKRAGCQRSVTLINSTSYAPIIGVLGIDAVVSPKVTTVSIVLQHIRRGKVRSAYSLGNDFGEVLELEALDTSPLVGAPLRDIKFPDGIVIGAIVRRDNVIMPTGNTQVEPEDRVILFARSDMVKKAQRMFAVKLEFF